MTEKNVNAKLGIVHQMWKYKYKYRYKYKYKYLCCQEVDSGDDTYGGGEGGSGEENVSAGVNLKQAKIRKKLGWNLKQK